VRWLHLVPPAGARADYITELDRICRRHRIAAVVPSVPAEIDALSGLSDPVRLPSGIPVICLPRAYRDAFDDKLAAFRALEGFVPLAPFADGSSPGAVADLVSRHGFPVVVKRRNGRGGEAFQVVDREEGLSSALAKTPDPVVQAWIDDQGGEYTVGLFATPERIASISFRRRLGRTGSSWFAETSTDPEVLRYAQTIARVSGLRGSANVQVRKSSAGVAGFRDAEWSILLALGREPDIPAEGFRQIRFHRFVHEMVDLGDGYGTIPQWSRWTRGKIVKEPPGGLSTPA
jgi:carbamoylphosphate synthase large subunit